jgi:hypothetical protein
MTDEPPDSDGENPETRPRNAADSHDHDPDDGTTTSTRTRWEHTGTLLALIVVAAPWFAAAAFVSQGEPVPLWLSGVITVESLAGTAWTFGSGAVKTATDALGGPDP